jgi:hypothetical protein
LHNRSRNAVPSFFWLGELGAAQLFADQNQNASYKSQNSHDDSADSHVKKGSDSNKNEING